ncbi:hypothetical protein OIU76_017468 [Salix suchowensis]|nr:hypothetical protein OIU76_017468 [Salix suchowensis]
MALELPANLEFHPDYFIDILEGIAKPESGVNYKQIPVRWMVHNGYPVPRDMLQNTELQMDWDCPPVKTLLTEKVKLDLKQSLLLEILVICAFLYKAHSR